MNARQDEGSVRLRSPEAAVPTEAPPQATGAVRARSLHALGALAALFLMPLAASFWLYYGIGWSPAKRVNHGELMQPVSTLPAVTLPAAGGAPVANVFAKRWALVYVGDGRCDSACRSALYVMRWARLALGADTSRVERVFLATGECCDEAFLAHEQPGLIALDASGSSARHLLEFFPRDDRNSMIFVVDPLGNLMMRYDSRRDPRGLLEDLQLLLRLSNIG